MATKIGRNEPCPCGSGKSYKDCCLAASRKALADNQLKLGAITCFCSEHYVIALQVGDSRHKILQITFGRKDGSLYVSFPYFKHSEGLVSLVTYPANIQQPTDLSLVPGGKATSHLVKYSHHPDGRAQFSQDGRVFTVIKKQSVSLDKAEGHIFTAQIQGLADFEASNSSRDNESSKKRTVLTFELGKQEPEAVKLVGWWYSQRTLEKRFVVGTASDPRVTCITPEGRKHSAFVLTRAHDLAKKQYALVLACETIPTLDKNSKSALTFIGGFDPSDRVYDASFDTTFLALSYPVSSFEELVQQIGSIDFIRQSSDLSPDCVRT